jgi:membrane-associated phospholipid phosphatase
MSTQWALLIWLDLFWERGLKSVQSFCVLAVAVTFFASVMYARIYVGVHAIN